MRLRTSFIQAAIITIGLSHIFVGVTQLLFPEWFWQTIGYFPPFNSHYVRDMGSFQLPLGRAARQPYQNRALLGCAVLGNLLHALNHLYDDVLLGTVFSGQTVLLGLTALAFALSVWDGLRLTSYRMASSRR